MIVLVGAGAVGQRGRLAEGEAHHLRVRRARDGEVVEMRDGAGLMGSGRLVLRGREWEVEVERAERLPRPAELTLAVGAGDRERFAWVVEKAAELGVTTIVPLATERTAGVRPGCGRSMSRSSGEPRSRRSSSAALPGARRPSGGAGGVAARPSRHGGARRRRCRARAAGARPSPLTVVWAPRAGSPAATPACSRGRLLPPVALGPHTLRFEIAAIAAAAAAAAA
jgi:16S rRNA (uracil1498-N3)-methyltransferase